MAEPVVEPIERIANRLNEEAKSALLGHSIGHPNGPGLDYVIMIFTRDQSRWVTYRSNMDMRLLINSIASVGKLMVEHLQNRITKDKR